MKRFAFGVAATLVALTACGAPAESESADDFASRIGSGGNGTPVAQGTVAPTVQETKPGAAPGPFTPGTQTDPESACGASLVGEFIGRLADDATRMAVKDAARLASEVRFVSYGGVESVNPDPTDPRLNLMLDQQGIIRDARCG